MSATYANLNGLVLVDKPAGPTSHAIVSAFKRALRPERIGHLGTLDPFASGLLPILLGGATRLADDAMGGAKGYEFTIGFGAETDTLDLQGQVVREASTENVTATALETVLERFRGAIEQVPPAYSALKINGRPLYEYMRAEGKLPIDIESKRRTVTVHAISLLKFTAEDATTGKPTAVLSARVSKGTYVRCLARDIASSLGSAGTCVTLRRTFVEPWSVDDALVLRMADREILNADALLALLQPPEAVVPQMRAGELLLTGDDAEKKLLSGNPFSLDKGRIPCDDSGALPHKGLVRCGRTLYLAEFFDVGDTVKVQPRKKLDWIST